jgi:hypothetical protein
MMGISYQFSLIITMAEFTAEEGVGGDQSKMVWMASLFVLVQIIVSISLLRHSKRIADKVIGNNTETLESHPQLPSVLTHVGILLIGISALVHNLPRFLSTSILWFQAHVQLPEEMAGRQNEAMAEATLLLIISLFLVLRSKTLTRWIFRISR